MDNKQIYRSALLNNVTKMCEYIEKELEFATNNFQIEYERGFIYGWKADYIGYSYLPNKKKATFFIHHNSGRSLWIEDGKVYEELNGECTNTFLCDFKWYRMDELQKAITITQDNWFAIKNAVAEHKRKERNTLNFTI